MANTAQLLRRQSSRDIVLKSQKSIDQLELRVSRGDYIEFIYLNIFYILLHFLLSLKI